MKVWITKYALTQGIYTCKNAEELDCCGLRIYAKNKAGWGSNYYRKPDWHTSKEEAVAHAESMRVKKLASLKKQIAKLEKLEIKVAE